MLLTVEEDDKGEPDKAVPRQPGLPRRLVGVRVPGQALGLQAVVEAEVRDENRPPGEQTSDGTQAELVSDKALQLSSLITTTYL